MIGIGIYSSLTDNRYITISYESETEQSRPNSSWTQDQLTWSNKNKPTETPTDVIFMIT